MKTINSIKGTLLIAILILSGGLLQAQDTTVVTPVPVATPTETAPPPAPVAAPTNTEAPAAAATTAAAPPPEKAKKDGFNSHTRFGARFGGIASTQDYESNGLSENPQSKIGLDLAILCAIPIGSGLFMIQPELHWMQKGYKIDDAIPNGDITSTLNYLELPVLLRVNIGGSLKVFGFAGPSVGYLMSGTYEDELNGEKDPKEYLDDVEYSGHIGIGAGLGTLELDIRYIAGLNDISDSDDLSDVKNSSVGIGLTLKF